MRADHVGAPVTPQQWDYIHDMGGALRESLNNVTAVFAPSCIGHSVLTKRDWLNIKIDDISLADALRCWEQADTKDRQIQRRQSNKNPQNPQKLRRKHNGARRNKQHLNGTGTDDFEREMLPRQKLTKEERERRRQERRERENQRRLSRLNRKIGKDGNHTRHQQQIEESLSTKVPRIERSPNSIGNSSNNLSSNANPKTPRQKQNGQHRLRNQNKKRLNHKNRNRKQNMNNRKQNQQNMNAYLRAVDIAEPKKCSLRLLERCSWPQCNHSCPTLTNPLTGEEMKFLELLASFGLDMDAVATALGVDMQTLNNMDQAELVNLLTQQVT